MCVQLAFGINAIVLFSSTRSEFNANCAAYLGSISDESTVLIIVLISMLCSVFVFCAGVLPLLLFHIFLVRRNLTTLEFMTLRKNGEAIREMQGSGSSFSVWLADRRARAPVAAPAARAPVILPEIGVSLRDRSAEHGTPAPKERQETTAETPETPERAPAIELRVAEAALFETPSSPVHAAEPSDDHNIYELPSYLFLTAKDSDGSPRRSAPPPTQALPATPVGGVGLPGAICSPPPVKNR